MKKNILIVVLAIIAIGLAGYTAILSYKTKNTPVPTITQTLVQQNSDTQNNNSTATPNIKVISPKDGDTIELPLKVSGEVRVFENQFSIRIKDGNGKILTEVSAMGQNGDAGQYNLFEKEINYPNPATAEGTIEVFDYSAKDGSEIDKVTIPIKFGYVADALNIEVFFGNSKKDPNGTDCQKVYSVLRRIAYTREVAHAALSELLLGPTKDEQAQGYFSSINLGAQLKDITINNGVATADFDETLQSGIGGSCKVVNIRSQITETLKQFATVNSVTISIDGKTGDILQP